jgi:dynein heavy chain 2
LLLLFPEGLPSDELSIENAISILQSQLSPFLIDPSSRASDWIKTHLGTGEKPIEVANPKDDRLGGTNAVCVM